MGRPCKYQGNLFERRKQWHKAYYKKNKYKFKIYSSRYDSKIRSQILELFGNKCCKCGYNTDLRALQIDHINRAKVPRNHRLRSGQPLYNAILRGEVSIKEFQLLCANCNWLKKLDNKEHHPITTSIGDVAITPQG